MAIQYVFIYLQLLHLLTTLVGFRLGAVEGSPFIRLFMHAGPAMGILASKALALALGAFCVYSRRNHLIRLATYWYSCLVVWNLMIMLVSAGRPAA